MTEKYIIALNRFNDIIYHHRGLMKL